jgi:chemotaxis protein methyltransferase CheR
MLTDNQLNVLISDLHELYGYDFSLYAKASLKRRAARLFMLHNHPSFAELCYRLKHDPHYVKLFIEELTVNVTEMFRDPTYYLTLRNKILPQLGTYPFIRIWFAGCSTGEEVYSVAIILKELKLLHKSLLYATDINATVLQKAKNGVFALSNMRKYSQNYIESGGQLDFSSYYTANYHGAKFSDELSKQMIYSTHNLVSDYSFNEFNLIICRNVLIYFERELQERVFHLFDKSLVNLGYLALGNKETIKFSSIHPYYKQVDNDKIWRKEK